MRQQNIEHKPLPTIDTSINRGGTPLTSND